MKMIKPKQHYSKFVLPFATAHPESFLARALAGNDLQMIFDRFADLLCSE